MAAYYNEIDPYAAQWLRNLIAKGQIAPGDVDTRSIEDVHPDDLRGYAQCHFFAGIGGWSLAARLAGIPDDFPLWTGSCPCQPFSAAGQGAGFADERHLWPAFYHLIGGGNPAIIAGEQVASPAVGPWLDLVQADLEGLGYSFGAVPFPAAGIGAPHIRDRTYWMGHTNDARLEGLRGRLEAAHRHRQGPLRSAAPSGELDGLANADHEQQQAGEPRVGEEPHPGGRLEGAAATSGLCGDSRPGPVNGHWRAADWLLCRDGKWRPVEPGTFPLAHGVPGRVGRLRAYGNAIIPQQAAIFLDEAFGVIRAGIRRPDRVRHPDLAELLG